MKALFILLYIVSSVSATFMVVFSKIFEPLRKWAARYTTLLNCSLCTGFWVSMLNFNWMWAIYTYHLPMYLLTVNIALCGALFSYTYYCLMEKLNKPSKPFTFTQPKNRIYPELDLCPSSPSFAHTYEIISGTGAEPAGVPQWKCTKCGKIKQSM